MLHVLHVIQIIEVLLCIEALHFKANCMDFFKNKRRFRETYGMPTLSCSAMLDDI
jgi:hypothetical protein